MYANTVPDPTHRLASTLKSKSRVSHGYLAAWAAIGCISALYIGQVAWTSVDRRAPGVASDIGGSAASEAKRLRQTLVELQRDLSRVRTDLVNAGFDAAVVATVAAIEERTSMVTGLAVTKIEPKASPAAVVVATRPAVPQPAPQPEPANPIVAAALSTTPATTTTSATSPQAELTPITLAPQGLDKLMAPIETGSLAPATVKASAQPKTAAGTAAPALATAGAAAAQATPIAFGPAVVKTAPKPFAVQLASGSTLDAIKLSWSLLAEQHADTLHALQPRYTASGTEQAGQTFDLVAGPVKTAADAKRICKALAARGTDCKVAPFAGEAL